MSLHNTLADEHAAVCHECGEWRRECACDPQCEQQDKPLWPDMAESDYAEASSYAE